MRTALSHSRIELLEDCPLKFKAIVLDKTPWKKGLPLYNGGFLHDLAEAYINYLTEIGIQSDIKGGLELFEEKWMARHEDKEFKAIPEAEHDQLLEAWTSFIEDRVFEPDNIVGSEMEIALDGKWEQVDWFDKERAFFRAKMDLVTLTNQDPPTVTDFKSSYNASSKDEAERNPQGRRYIMALLSTKGRLGSADEYRVIYDFMRSNVQREVILTRGHGLEERDRTFAISEKLEKRIKKNEWDATPGNGCHDCPLFESACPAKGLAAPERGIQDPETAKQMLAHLIMLNEQAKRIRGALEGYTATAGIVESGGQVFGPRPMQDYAWDILTLREWANRNGISIEDIVRPRSRTELEKLARKTADKKKAIDELLGIATIENGTEYRIRKATGE